MVARSLTWPHKRILRVLGKHVTLGWYEREDLFSVITYLQEQFGFTEYVFYSSTLRYEHSIIRFILWGRSMGAVAALMYVHECVALKIRVRSISYVLLFPHSALVVRNGFDPRLALLICGARH